MVNFDEIRKWEILELDKNNIDKGLEYINKAMVLAPFDNLPLYYYDVYVNKSDPKKITEFKLPGNYVVKFKRWYNSNIINI